MNKILKYFTGAIAGIASSIGVARADTNSVEKAQDTPYPSNLSLSGEATGKGAGVYGDVFLRTKDGILLDLQGSSANERFSAALGYRNNREDRELGVNAAYNQVEGTSALSLGLEAFLGENRKVLLYANGYRGDFKGADVLGLIKVLENKDHSSDLKLGLGAYTFEGEAQEQTSGGRLALRARYALNPSTEIIAAGDLFSSDEVRGGYSASIGLRKAFGEKRKNLRAYTPMERLEAVFEKALKESYPVTTLKPTPKSKPTPKPKPTPEPTPTHSGDEGEDPIIPPQTHSGD
jgi:hypothetical protein